MRTNALSHGALEKSLERTEQAAQVEQYSPWQILGIWASVALPMGLIYWIVIPILLSGGNANPFLYLFLIVLGLVWQGVVAYVVLRREVKPFSWQGVRDRLWLPTPSNPGTASARRGCTFGSSPLSR